jgi:hypothetical protein
MLFMTTNHIEKLDPALIRPGRCDVKQLVDNATRDQMRRLFIRFFAGQTENAELFASKLPEGELSMAKLQGFLLEHKNDETGQSAVDAVPTLLLQSKPQSLNGMSSFDHLRRVGLERFAPLFHHHGYMTKSEIEEAELKAADCGHWCFDLESDPHAMRRLKLLLETGGEKLLEHYALAELSTVQDAFIGNFFGQGDHAAGGWTIHAVVSY